MEDIYPCILQRWCRQTSNISRTFGNKLDHSDVVGTSPVALLHLHVQYRLNTQLQWTGRRELQDETRNIKFWNLVRLISEVWRYIGSWCLGGEVGITRVQGWEIGIWITMIYISFVRAGVFIARKACFVVVREAYFHRIQILTHPSLDKMAAISQTMFSDAFSWTKSFVFWLKFPWN